MTRGSRNPRRSRQVFAIAAMAPSLSNCASIGQSTIALMALALCVAALASCSPAPPSACAGLVYKEYGLSRQEYAPCAKAMVEKLDRMHEVMQVMGDPKQPKEARLDARGDCLRASSELARLIVEAGGTEKLVTMRWDDTALSLFNLDVTSARSAYFMYCFYGLTGPDVMKLDSSHARAKEIAESLR